MTNKIIETIERFEMLSHGDAVAVGFSGGADSVCLLHFLSRIRDRYAILLKAVHINHGIRGSEAKRDEEFARVFCKNNDIELEVFAFDVPSLAKENGIGLEECGRLIRYETFESVGCDKVAVAHTASDNAETVLFNLSRGCGTKGIAGIPPKRGKIIRPLINLTREDVERYCAYYGLEFVNDSSNSSLDYSRNKIRHLIVPVLKEINLSFEKNVSTFCEIVSRENCFLDSNVEKLLIDSFENGGYSKSKLLNADEALLYRAIGRILEENDIDADSVTVELCVHALNVSTSVQLKKDLFFDASGTIVFFRSAPVSFKSWKVEASLGKTQTPFGIFELKKLPVSDIPLEKRDNAFDFEKINPSELVFRSRKESDRFSDPVRKVSKSVKKLFIESKIPSHLRNAVPILSCGDEIVWIKGFRCDSKYSINSQTRTAVIIEEKENEQDD